MRAVDLPTAVRSASTAVETTMLLAEALRAAGQDGETTVFSLDGHQMAAMVPADRCSACNRHSPTMRNRGGVLWCGRTDCLTAIRELRGDG
jgi:hypothetical protein